MTPPLNNKVNPGLRAKFRHKRRIIMGLWTLWFAYISLTHEVQPVSARPGERNVKDREDQHTYSTVLNWRAPDGYSVSRGQLLQATGGEGGSELEEDLEEYLLPGYNCTNPSILEFPPDLFTQSERQNGAIVVHFLASMYVFYAIAVVCDDYFVPSIECICGELHLPSDVAGATFMAVATSAPELFTNVIGTFITEGDIGVGTIVGSAVFNLLAVCACCGFAASAALPLDWYPLTRDCIFYSISVVLLLFVLENRQVHWYEALILVLAYVVYIIVMWKNTALKHFSERTVGKIARYCGCFRTRMYTSKDEKTPLLKADFPPSMETRLDENEQSRKDERAEPSSYDEILIAKALHQNEEEAEEEEGASALMCGPNDFGNQLRLKLLRVYEADGNHCYGALPRENGYLQEEAGLRIPYSFRGCVVPSITISAAVDDKDPSISSDIKSASESPRSIEDASTSSTVVYSVQHFVSSLEQPPAKEKYGVFHLPRGEGCVTITEWVLGWPARFIFTLTVPDCRKAHLRKFYPLTFIMCIVYIALLSYVVSWMMTVIGHTLRIPDSVMGLTFIAAGTSVPEAVSSIIVAKQGLGSMSISNSIGSNTFDILMCLGLPWLIKGSMIANDEENFIQINSGGLEYSVIILIVSLLLLYVLLASNGFYLDKKVATIAAVLYALFLVFASLLELNVFFVLNQPTCSIDL